jgi:site-specific DNA recombinase
MRTTLCDCTKLDADIAKWQEEIEVVAELVKNCVQSNASDAQWQEEYSKRYDSLVKRYEKAMAKHEALTTERTRRTDRDKKLHLFIEALRERPSAGRMGRAALDNAC